MTNKLMLAFTLALLSAAPALAQDTSSAFDSRWNPYLGCWAILQGQSAPSAPVPAGTMVCVRPSGRFGVAITTTVDGKNVLEQTIIADGSAQPLSQGDCNGTQVSNWSRDGERLFTKVELDCANRPKRVVSGITLLANGQWIDAQATVIDGNSDVRVRRYRRSSDPYTGSAGMTTVPLSVEDIIEASAKVQSEALEAALDEANARFELNSRILTQLADNGVSPNVIDLMVAQAYPEKFEVQRGASTWGSSATYSTGTLGSSSVFMGSTMYPFPMYDPFYSSYYYYSPFAYPYYWGPSYTYRYGSPFYRNYNNYNYYGVPAPYYYGGGSSGGGDGRNAQPGSPDAPGGNATITGRGYTRVRPSGSSNSSGSDESATPSSRSSGSTRGARIVSGSDAGASSSSSSSSSGSSGTSSGGYSSGSSNSGGGSSSGGGGGGRTAQPR